MQTEDYPIIQTKRFRESSFKHCKTGMLIEKNLANFLACHSGGLWAKYTYLASHKKFEHFLLDFEINQCWLILQFILTVILESIQNFLNETSH